MRKKPERRIHFHWPVAFFALLMMSLTLAAFFPGGMSPDTLNQLSQARSGNYTDQHQPFMAFVWRILLHLWDNPGVLFTVHVLAYWGLFYLLASSLFKAWKGQLLSLLGACLPPFWSQVFVVWKDTELSLALAAAVLCGLWAKRMEKGGGWLTASSFLFLFFASAARENALPALIPWMAFLLATQWPKLKPPRAVLLAGLASAAALAGVYVLDYGILRAEKTHPQQVNAIYDITGTFVGTGQEALIPSYWKKLNPSLTPAELAAHYDPNSVISLVFWGEPLVPLTQDPDQLGELWRKWREAALGHPGAWLEHRLRVFQALMGLGMPLTYYPYHFGVHENDLGLRDEGNPLLQGAVRAYVSFFRNSFFFRGWAYLVFLSALVGWLARARATTGLLTRPAFGAACSGLLYGLGYFAYATAADFRFLYPTVLLTLIASLLAAAEHSYLKASGGRIS